VTSADFPLALTLGDPAGIGPDITLAAWGARAELGGASFALIGGEDQLRARARRLGVSVPVRRIDRLREAAAVFPAALPVLPLEVAPDMSPEPGRPDPRLAPLIVASIERAVALCHDGEALAVVTNPIAKSVLYAAGFEHPGHTEFLAALAGRYWGGTHRSIMMLAADELRVVPLTVHVPLARVPAMITRELLIETVAIAVRALERDFGLARPRIAVAGLNPHAGEGGGIGCEEADVIIPAIAEMKARGLVVTGPFPADTLFHAAARTTYDAAVCMYHDQALVPLKTIAFERGVNVTLGLPYVRTSPDHGTAFDISGTGKANPTSLIEALKLAWRLGARRTLARA
jgi:4-hydroxythreonine-4-phosphate dehydrogenase